MRLCYTFTYTVHLTCSFWSITIEYLVIVAFLKCYICLFVLESHLNERSFYHTRVMEEKTLSLQMWVQKLKCHSIQLILIKHPTIQLFSSVISMVSFPTCFSSYCLCVFFSASLKERHHLECLCSTLAMPSWVVGFWDCPMPCPTLVSSSFCEYHKLNLRFTTKHNVNALEVWVGSCMTFLTIWMISN